MKTCPTTLVCRLSQKTSRAETLRGMEITHKNSTNLGPEGKRKRGRLKSTGRTSVEVERNQVGLSSWKMAENAALYGLIHQLGCEEDR